MAFVPDCAIQDANKRNEKGEKLKPTAFFVFAFLCKNFDWKRNLVPVKFAHYKFIARQLGLNPTHISDCKKQLETFNWILETKHGVFIKKGEDELQKMQLKREAKSNRKERKPPAKFSANAENENSVFSVSAEDISADAEIDKKGITNTSPTGDSTSRATFFSSKSNEKKLHSQGAESILVQILPDKTLLYNEDEISEIVRITGVDESSLRKDIDLCLLYNSKKNQMDALTTSWYIGWLQNRANAKACDVTTKIGESSKEGLRVFGKRDYGAIFDKLTGRENEQ